jgi:hypothetical protein
MFGFAARRQLDRECERRRQEQATPLGYALSITSARRLI